MLKLILSIFLMILPFKSHASEIPPTCQTVVFDFGGVMVDFSLQDFMKSMAEELHMPMEEFKAAIKTEIPTLATGKLKEKDFWIAFSEKYNTSLPKDWDDKYREVIKRLVKPKKEMYDLVVRLKEKGYQVAMLSDVTEWQASVFQELSLYEGFDPLVLSYEINTRKPKEDSYLLLLQKLNKQPSQCIFIDDRIENVEEAKKLGIQALTFESYDNLIQALQELHILN
ncbi:MAG: HAD family phosphatase [Chlamydiota bacterium]|jgi:epoxide hydrolase-like predicted phosphatase